MDAVDRRKNELNEEDYTRRLWLTINLNENSFTITDNGVGFKEKEFKSFLAPNISFKDGSLTRGNKGVGATYIAYGLDCLQFGTKGNSHEFFGEINNGREWVEDNHGIVTRPIVVEAQSTDPYFMGIDRGSTFKIRYGGQNSRPKDLSWYNATTPEQWLYLLLLKTPLGSIDYLGETSDHIKFSFKVIDRQNLENVLSDLDAEYIFPHTKIGASVNIKDVIAFESKLTSQGRDASALPTKYYKSNGIYEFYSTKDLISFRNLEDSAQKMLQDYQVEAYGYFAYSTSIWDQLNDSLAKLRKGYRVLKGGL